MNNSNGNERPAESANLIAVFVLAAIVGGGSLFLINEQRSMMAREREMRLAAEAALASQHSDRFVPVAQNRLRTSEESKLRLLTWNVESGGNNPTIIAEQLKEFRHYDILGLCEVAPANSRRYTKALGDRFRSIISVTGRNDRLVLIYDAERFELTGNEELEAYDGTRMNDVNFRHRSPLVGKFKDRSHDFEFQVVLVHLARGWAELRQEQALGLRKWAAAQKVPTFGIGDFNFDYDFPTQKGNKAFQVFTADNTWKWMKPDPLVDTNWSDRDGDGKDNYPDSCLDLTFVAGMAREWKSRLKVIVREGDFPDSESTSDHRPVELIATLSMQ